MKQHLPVGFSERMFKDIDDKGLKPDVVRRALGLKECTFYRKRRQWRNGGVLPRKPGSGRKTVYQAKDYEPMIKEILKDLPPVVGHRRVWMAMKRKGATMCQGTA